jgi:anion-transporting  ArsA/GET3 family ATPase
MMRELLGTRRVVVCCGAGGVGKTTTAAALGVAAAQLGKRVLVLTIDPARRLAEALGISENGLAPAALAPALQAEAGIAPPAELHAWMLNTRVVFEGLVSRLSATPEAARRILDTALFRHLSELVAGMQEYTAAEALYELASERRYDLIVLDTPPSRNALDFLDAPGRLSRFLDERILRLFLPDATAFILLRKAAARIQEVLSRVFGEAFFREMQEFLSVSKGLFGPLREHAADVRRLLHSQDASFLLVTTSDEAALAEARFFRAKLATGKLPFAGFVLNRSWASAALAPLPSELLTHDSASVRSPALTAGLTKLEAIAQRERSWAARDRAFLERLRGELGGGAVAVAAPDLGDALDGVAGLARLAEALVRPVAA